METSADCLLPASESSGDDSNRLKLLLTDSAGSPAGIVNRQTIGSHIRAESCSVIPTQQMSCLKASLEQYFNGKAFKAMIAFQQAGFPGQELRIT